MKGAGRMFMNHEQETAFPMRTARFRFGCFLEFPFGCVFC